MIYRYDGRKVEQFCPAGFQIWNLHGKGKIIYAGGCRKQGILSIPVNNPEGKRTLLEDCVDMVYSIVTAPLDFIEKLNKGDKNA